ncbi:LysM peptidoglycan-binding domain-containing protein [Hymenobacter oligotrophus]|uniref:LysM peptidoglycan-binding domain-containing protein n=1 Tax=Hymenobacter oligotrophus TaxID=2319843 RepID=A0A3B7R109_9BACT|nr:LysM peptidoglycan-binding domain-containing protein [Hymenobacter oligotrophus]AYA37462.1 LysM peptidoglycan-binding domain-containing protein [Hymenobacter oligotrophus]
MGLFDFLSDKGEKKPVQPTQPQKPAGGAADFFGNPQQAQQAQPAAAQGESYTVVSGDSLSKIAKKHYGDASKWHQIYDANKSTIGSNPDHIEVGQVLKLPKL